MSADLRFCPRCAGALEVRDAGHPASPHPTCTACGFVLWQNMKPSVEAMIVRDEGSRMEVLLGRRTMPGGRIAWDMPGGFLNADDRVASALRRECLREMGVEIEVGEILGAFDDDFAAVHIVSIVFLCRIIAGEPRGADIIDGVRWFGLDEHVDAASPAVADALDCLRRRILR